MFFMITTFLAFSTGSIAIAAERPCLVREVLNEGSYTYVHCQEGSAEVWISTLKITLRVGDRITFTDAPPMVNFESKSLKRTFTRVIFTAVTLPGETKSNFEKAKTHKNSKVDEPDNAGSEGVFSATDEEGTLVFSDDPSKVPSKKTRR
jgi:hypothetical protein